MKIILVDDDRMALDGISRMLHWEQFNGQLVGCATNGEEAVALLEAHHPDVVISDIRMPGMDGLELARYLYEHCPNTRMILISGHGEFEYAQRALQYQVTDYILKPITRAKLNSLEERLAAISAELSADVPPWYACDEALRTQVSQALRKGDMAAMGELLISQDVFRSLADLRAAAPADCFVIGGASVYAALLDGCDTAYITKIDRAWAGADAFFPNLDADPAWFIAEEGEPMEHEGTPFRYVTYRRRGGHVLG